MDIGYDFFSIEKRDKVPARGRVLVSEPFLPDEYFKRTIVFLTEYTEEGTLGFVLNKPVAMKIHQLIADFPEVDIPVSVGGPVATDTVHYIHTLGDIVPESKHVTGEIYWGGDYETLKALVRQGVAGPGRVRFFIGYSGWDAGQLERELSEGSWVITTADTREIMQAHTPEVWRDILKKMGRKYKIWADFPENPDLN